jgi:hypothetical protein
VYFNLYISDSKLEDKRYGPNGSRHYLSSIYTQRLHECNFDLLWFFPNMYMNSDQL